MPYCYKITHIPTNRFYIGIRYAKKAKSFAEDFFKNYFTSSKIIHSILSKEPTVNFKTECILESDDIELIMSLEKKLILENIENPLSLNLCYQAMTLVSTKAGILAMTTRAKRDSVARRILKVRKEYKLNKAVDKRCVDKIIEHIDWLEKNGEFHRKIRDFLSGLLLYEQRYSNKKCRLIQNLMGNNLYVAEEYILPLLAIGYKIDNIKLGTEKVREVLSGTIYMTNGEEEKQAVESDVAFLLSEGWLRGRSNRFKKSLSDYREVNSGKMKRSDKTKNNISLASRGKIYYTSPCFTVLRAFREGDVIPPDWIKGNKLKSRNDKISQNHKSKRK